MFTLKTKVPLRNVIMINNHLSCKLTYVHISSLHLHRMTKYPTIHVRLHSAMLIQDSSWPRQLTLCVLYTVVACLKNKISETMFRLYLVMSYWVLLHNSLPPKHLIRLLYLRFIFQHFAPVIQQLDAPVFHPLSCHVAQKLITTSHNVHRVAQNKVPHRRICNISATSGLTLKILKLLNPDTALNLNVYNVSTAP